MNSSASKHWKSHFASVGRSLALGRRTAPASISWPQSGSRPGRRFGGVEPLSSRLEARRPKVHRVVGVQALGVVACYILRLSPWPGTAAAIARKATSREKSFNMNHSRRSLQFLRRSCVLRVLPCMSWMPLTISGVVWHALRCRGALATTLHMAAMPFAEVRIFVQLSTQLWIFTRAASVAVMDLFSLDDPSGPRQLSRFLSLLWKKA